MNRKHGTAVELPHGAERTIFLGELVGGLIDPPGWRPPASRRAGRSKSAVGALALSPEVYVERLTGQRVGRSRKVRCPLEMPAGLPSPGCSLLGISVRSGQRWALAY